MLSTLHRSGIRIRDQVQVRVDRSPRQLVEDWGGSPLGVLWQGRGTLARRMGTRGPVDGVYLAGAHTTPGAGLPSVGLSAALVAQLVGPG
jgi:UDP-galactopyranose mutase